MATITPSPIPNTSTPTTPITVRKPIFKPAGITSIPTIPSSNETFHSPNKSKIPTMVRPSSAQHQRSASAASSIISLSPVSPALQAAMKTVRNSPSSESNGKRLSGELNVTRSLLRQSSHTLARATTPAGEHSTLDKVAHATAERRNKLKRRQLIQQTEKIKDLLWERASVQQKCRLIEEERRDLDAIQKKIDEQREIRQKLWEQEQMMLREEEEEELRFISQRVKKYEQKYSFEIAKRDKLIENRNLKNRIREEVRQAHANGQRSQTGEVNRLEIVHDENAEGNDDPTHDQQKEIQVSTSTNEDSSDEESDAQNDVPADVSLAKENENQFPLLVSSMVKPILEEEEKCNVEQVEVPVTPIPATSDVSQAVGTAVDEDIIQALHIKVIHEEVVDKQKDAETKRMEAEIIEAKEKEWEDLKKKLLSDAKTLQDTERKRLKEERAKEAQAIAEKMSRKEREMQDMIERLKEVEKQQLEEQKKLSSRKEREKAKHFTIQHSFEKMVANDEDIWASVLGKNKNVDTKSGAAKPKEESKTSERKTKAEQQVVSTSIRADDTQNTNTKAQVVSNSNDQHEDDDYVYPDEVVNSDSEDDSPTQKSGISQVSASAPVTAHHSRENSIVSKTKEPDSNAISSMLRELEEMEREEEELLRNGLEVTKIPRSGKAKLVQLYLDVDEDGDWCLRWDTKKKNKADAQVKLRSSKLIRGTTEGAFKKADNNQKYAAKKASCFSLLNTSRSLDIVCTTYSDAELWTRSLGRLIKEKRPFVRAD